TQGAYDLSGLRWDAVSNCLSGNSKCVEGEVCRLTLYVPEGCELASVNCNENAAFTREERILKVDLNPVRSGYVAWKLNFKTK
ncbi:MAG: hypothetical protein WCV67_21180, partial [Victivallaceae bacterium]